MIVLALVLTCVGSQWLAFEFAFLYRYLIETKNGRSLEEISAIFDGVEASNRISEKATEAAHHDTGSDQQHYAIDEKMAEKGELSHVESLRN